MTEECSTPKAEKHSCRVPFWSLSSRSTGRPPDENGGQGGSTVGAAPAPSTNQVTIKLIIRDGLEGVTRPFENSGMMPPH